VGKPETKKTSPVFWVALIGIGAAVYVYTTPEETKASKIKPKPKASSKVSKDGFTDADYTAKFPALNQQTRNSFKPVVVSLRGSGSGAPGTTGSPWIFTGTAEVDGKLTALIENSATGEGQFLGVGDSWMTMTVTGISSTAVRLLKEDGDVIAVKLEGTMSGEPVNTGQAPLAPPTGGNPLRGPIGNVDVRPLNANAAPAPGAPALETSRNQMGVRNAN
jgi:hypothetical protein